jgi:hypothetical protein
MGMGGLGRAEVGLDCIPHSAVRLVLFEAPMARSVRRVRSEWLIGIALALATGCATLPGPPRALQPEAAFVEVPGPPPPARVEVVPPRPRGAVAWVDGSWMWEGTRWKWSAGGWFSLAGGLRYADWIARRREDGTMLYANPQWQDARGEPVAAPPRAATATAIGGGVDETKS